MASENYLSGMFQPVVLNGDGFITVAAGYKAKFYAAGTDIPKTIYTDPALLTPYSSPSNIALLDETGKALIYLGVGGYKLVLTDPDDNPVAGYTIDNIIGIGSFGTGFVNSFAALKNVNTNIFPYTYIGGYFSPGDGGEGMFFNQPSEASADGGYIQDSDFDPTKRWFRIPDENGDVRAASFGYMASTGTIQTDQMLAADAYAGANGARLLIAGGTGAQIATMTFTTPVVSFAPGAVLKGTVDVPAIGFTGIVEGPVAQIFNRMTVIFGNTALISRPEWFGAVAGSGAGDQTTAIDAWKAAGGGAYLVLPPGYWNYANAGVFTSSLGDRKSTRLNSSHSDRSRMPSSA